MTEAQLYIIFSIAAIIPLLQIALSRFMQPLRIEFANLGFDLLQDPTINDRQRNLINKLLDDAYNWKAAIFLAIFALPVAMIQLIPVMLALSIILRSFEKSKSAIESQFFGYVATAKRI